jgi:hypothetical protein
MTTSTIAQRLSALDGARIAGAGWRYDFWLDLRSVPRTRRRELRAELQSNLTEAACRVGVGPAIRALGSVRRLAAETTRDGYLRSRWTAGWVAGVSALALLLVMFSS